MQKWARKGQENIRLFTVKWVFPFINKYYVVEVFFVKYDSHILLANENAPFFFSKSWLCEALTLLHC